MTSFHSQASTLNNFHSVVKALIFAVDSIEYVIRQSGLDIEFQEIFVSLGVTDVFKLKPIAQLEPDELEPCNIYGSPYYVRIVVKGLDVEVTFSYGNIDYLKVSKLQAGKTTRTLEYEKLALLFQDYFNDELGSSNNNILCGVYSTAPDKDSIRKVADKTYNSLLHGHKLLITQLLDRVFYSVLPESGPSTLDKHYFVELLKSYALNKLNKEAQSSSLLDNIETSLRGLCNLATSLVDDHTLSFGMNTPNMKLRYGDDFTGNSIEFVKHNVSEDTDLFDLCYTAANFDYWSELATMAKFGHNQIFSQYLLQQDSLFQN